MISLILIYSEKVTNSWTEKWKTVRHKFALMAYVRSRSIDFPANYIPSFLRIRRSSPRPCGFIYAAWITRISKIALRPLPEQTTNILRLFRF